jgi:hypothetical protein
MSSISRLFLCAAAAGWISAGLAADQRIRPWPRNTFYWEYQGAPTLLLGGSDDDNLFQWPAEELRPQLDKLKRAGGNYLRNTMSDRPDRRWEVYPFLKLADGKYDLERWNPEYWDRFERFLRWTGEREIIVQIEIWDRFDYSREHWPAHPYNPKNNVNYTYEQSGFAPEYPDHPGRNRQPFFFTTPGQRDNRVVLKHQQRFVDRMLSISLKHGHVLYCMDNETSGEPEWGRYWAKYVKAAAAKAGVPGFVTEMWDAHDLKAEQHRRTFDHPELYDFVDISQNNHISGEKHWINALWVREYLSARPRPINTVKTYGATGNKFGHTDQDGLERFWRHILCGVAAARFHRPDSGLGLNAKAEAALRAARKMETLVKAWELAPQAAPLRTRDGSAAYAAAARDQAYVVYFPMGGTVQVDAAPGKYAARWINASTGEWGPSARVAVQDRLELTAPGPGHWVAVLKK